MNETDKIKILKSAAKAIFDVAKKENKTDKIYEELVEW